jgi:hypothetical protein
MSPDEEYEARVRGWELDTSPETEMSNDIWWWHADTFRRMREDDLLNLLYPEGNK